MTVKVLWERSACKHMYGHYPQPCALLCYAHVI